LILTAETDRESRFFDHKPVEASRLDPDPQPVTERDDEGPDPLEVTVPEHEAPRAIPVGELVDEPNVEGGRGRRFGQRLHAFAARYALGRPETPEDDDQAHVAEHVDELAETATLKPEVEARLPVHVDGIDHVIEGKIDLVAVEDTAAHVVDWKTAPPGEGLEAYAQQVGLYAHVVARVHPDKDVQGWVVHTETGHAEPVEPLTREDVRQLVRAA
jgi:ATP-dependent exoDNAse (exonuclease V) beta subunit